MAWAVDIDGTQIRSYCQSIRWRQRLNAPASVIVRLPAHLFSCSIGDTELHLYDPSSNLVFSGPTWYAQADGSPNSTYVEITAYDHMIHFNKRLCKTASGNLITPGAVITTEITGPAIMAAYLTNAINDAKAIASPSAPLPLSVGSVASGGDDLSGVPTNFPMTLEQMRSLLCSTGQLNLLAQSWCREQQHRFHQRRRRQRPDRIGEHRVRDRGAQRAVRDMDRGHGGRDQRAVVSVGAT